MYTARLFSERASSDKAYNKRGTSPIDGRARARTRPVIRKYRATPLSNSRRVTKLYTRPAAVAVALAPSRIGYGRNRPDAVDSWAVYRPVILRYLVDRQRQNGETAFLGERVGPPIHCRAALGSE